MRKNARRERHLYFLELRDDLEPSVPRAREAELRHTQALAAMAEIDAWLRRMNLSDKVSSLAATALGQVSITCESDVLGRILQEECVPIIAVRNGAAYVDNLGKPLVGERLRVGSRTG